MFQWIDSLILQVTLDIQTQERDVLSAKVGSVWKIKLKRQFDLLIFSSTRKRHAFRTQARIHLQKSKLLSTDSMSSTATAGTLHEHGPCMTSSWYRCSLFLFIYFSFLRERLSLSRNNLPVKTSVTIID